MIEQDRQALGASVLQAIIEGNGRNAPTLLDLGQQRLAYEALFWRPYLGANPFALYQSLVAFAGSGPYGRERGDDCPHVGAGRPLHHPGPRRFGQDAVSGGGGGAAGAGGDCGPCTAAQGTMTAHTFHVLLSLPVLVPAQTALLDPALADMHEWYLGSLPGFDLVGWRRFRRGRWCRWRWGDTAVRPWARVSP